MSMKWLTIAGSYLQEQPAALSGWVIGFIVAVVLIIFFAWLLARSNREPKVPKPIQQDLIGGSSIPTTGELSKDPVAVPVVPEDNPHNRGVIKDLTHPDSDDLTLIEGIGPAMQEILIEAGINSYQKLAEADPAILKDMLADVRLNHVDPADWPEQARLAAAGDWERLEEMQRRKRSEAS